MFSDNIINEGTLSRGVINQIKHYFPNEQNEINKENAENAIIYGINCFEMIDNEFYRSIISVSPNTSKEILLINVDRNKVKRVKLSLIANIFFNKNSTLSASLTSFNVSNYSVEILIDRESYYYYFPDKLTFLLFLKGIRLLSFSNMDQSITSLTDENFNSKIQDKNLIYFVNYIGIEPKLFQKIIDANIDQILSQDEIKQDIKQKISGEQFRTIFEKYATLLTSQNEKVMGPVDLLRFFAEVQKEEICFYEACQIVIEFNAINEKETKNLIIRKFERFINDDTPINGYEIQKIISEYSSNKLRLYLTLFEFNLMLNSISLNVYNQKVLNNKLDLNRPISDYFINSTHNTYITNHQLAGKSSTKMYSTSLLYNYRLVELDCYNGVGDSIIITHGFTFVSELNLEDVLYELKNSAFVNSDLPVILSIENHLDEKHQKIMVKQLKKILVDLYVVPFDQKPKYIPTLNDLRKKFLVKCGGKKLWENEVIPLKPSLNDNLDKSSFFKGNSGQNNVLDKKKYEKHIIFLSDKYSKTIYYSRALTLHNSFSNAYNLQNGNIEKMEPVLEGVRGILSQKLNMGKIYTNYYKPWEMISVKCSKAMKFADNFNERKDIVNLTKKCLIKVYPESLDSSNYNIIKCFASGIQSCALNIQMTEEDYILYDTIFFKQNKGLGYVLKYDKFLSDNYDYTYDKPKYKCHMEILSVINCIRLIESANINLFFKSDINVNIYCIGINEDEKNPKVRCKLIKGYMFPSFEKDHPVIDYDVYEYELSAIMIKITYGSWTIGRSCLPYYFIKQGYRRIPIYDNLCHRVDDAYMVGYFDLVKV